MGRTLQKWLDLIYERLNGGVKINTDSDENVSVQNPLSIDGDSIYEKDINVTDSDVGTFTGDVTCMFNGITTCMTDSTTTNPKWFSVQLKRPMNTGQVNVTTTTGDFSNVKIVFYDGGGNVRYTIDETADNTKYTNRRYDGEPITFSSFKIEFHTTDTVNVGFISSLKTTRVVARIQGLNEDTNVIADVKVHDSSLRVSGHYEMLGEDKVTHASLETAIGSDSGIGTGSFQILSPVLYTQPTAETAMELVSDDAGDTNGVGGAEQVTIEYFTGPTTWVKKTLVTNMDGLTPVPLANTDVYRIHKMYINKGEVAIGTVTLQNIGGGITYGSIFEEAAIMERCVFYVREGYRVVVTDILLGCSTNAGVTWRLFASQEDPEGNVVPRGQLSIRTADAVMSLPLRVPYSVANPNKKRIAIGLAVKGALANQSATASLRGYEEAMHSA